MLDIATSMAADSSIQTWCRTNFNKYLTIRVGQDAEHAPSTDLCPMVIIVPGARGVDNSEQLKTRSIRFGISIIDASAVTSTTINNSAVYQYPGLAKLDAITDLIEKFLCNYRESSGYAIVGLGSGIDDSINNNVYQAWLALGVQLDSDY